MVTVHVYADGQHHYGSMSEAQVVQLVARWSMGGHGQETLALNYKNDYDESTLTFIRYADITAISYTIDTEPT